MKMFYVAARVSIRSLRRAVVGGQRCYAIDFANKDVLTQPSAVPDKPIKRLDIIAKPSEYEISPETIHLLEKLSLVDISDKEALQVLKDSIEFATQITHIDTEGVEPLYTVLENENLYLRPDIVTDGNIREDILRNAAVTEEEYFVAPPGNVIVEKELKSFD